MSDCSPFSINKALLEFSIVLDIELEQVVQRNLVNDTRCIKPHDIFCAVIGTEQDGRRYIEGAIKLGAGLVIAQCLDVEQHGCVTLKNIIVDERTQQTKTVAVVEFYQLDRYLFTLAKSYYQSPQDQLCMIGITGTNGKTSTSQIVAQLLNSCEQSCAVIGTVGAGLLDNLTELQNTTPGATQLHQLLNDFTQRKVSHVAMEISSHALTQHRVTSQLIDVAVFTNLSRDHLDYHKTMSNYAEAKYQLFSHDRTQTAVINGDDLQAKSWLKNWSSEEVVFVYGRGNTIKQFSHFVHASDIKHNNEGVTFLLDTHLGIINIQSPLMGDFNIDNLLAAIAVLLIQDYSLKDINQAITLLQPIIGRMESFSLKGKATAIVDYAHTPDALSSALIACRQHCIGELWVVFGCGGDRDKGKRSLMGKAAELHADHVVVTSDNPRHESANNILKDILLGFKKPEKATVTLNREEAVMGTLALAKPDDMVLFAGKGHEDYIIIGDKKISYNERQLVKKSYLNKALS
jgi:UDP-N-acetylmuramoyl-L-alanyl-D-glutamate--2,6-diaminopimelate ligase